MGISTHVTAFTSPEDPTYQKHKKVLLACMEAAVSLPKETAAYFGSDEPYKSLLEEKLATSIPVHEWDDHDMSQGYEILVSEIPKGVYKIRFSNSW